MLGTDYRGKGGIAFVLNNYKKNLLLKKINSKLIITHRSNLGKLDLVMIFFNALIKIIRLLDLISIMLLCLYTDMILEIMFLNYQKKIVNVD